MTPSRQLQLNLRRSPAKERSIAPERSCPAAAFSAARNALGPTSDAPCHHPTSSERVGKGRTARTDSAAHPSRCAASMCREAPACAFAAPPVQSAFHRQVSPYPPRLRVDDPKTRHRAPGLAAAEPASDVSFTLHPLAQTKDLVASRTGAHHPDPSTPDAACRLLQSPRFSSTTTKTAHPFPARPAEDCSSARRFRRQPCICGARSAELSRIQGPTWS